jgi:cysteine desulfurase
MKQVYFDNAATTPIDSSVVEVMLPYLTESFGNPSSTHSMGRKNKAAIELSRKKIAELLNINPSSICFTSGGTEADNMAIHCGINDLGRKNFISSPIEHHAVIHTLEELEAQGKIKLHLVNLNSNGDVDLNHLEELLSKLDDVMVCLMHGNNEIGNLLPLEQVGELCKKYNAIFHSDTVQTMGHYRFDLSQLPADFITGAAHKFHGPKGVGFLYINKKIKPKAFIHGGSQERNLRGGTENLYGIVGMAKALEICYQDLEGHQAAVREIKNYMIASLKTTIPEIQFNGKSVNEDSLYTVLNVRFPENELGGMLLFSLDIEGVCASGGSACSSGSNQGSHVLRTIGVNANSPSVRFSFSRYNTKEEVDYCIEVLKRIFKDYTCQV